MTTEITLRGNLLDGVNVILVTGPNEQDKNRLAAKLSLKNYTSAYNNNSTVVRVKTTVELLPDNNANLNISILDVDNKILYEWPYKIILTDTSIQPCSINNSPPIMFYHDLVSIGGFGREFSITLPDATNCLLLIDIYYRPDGGNNKLFIDSNILANLQTTHPQ